MPRALSLYVIACNILSAPHAACVGFVSGNTTLEVSLKHEAFFNNVKEKDALKFVIKNLLSSKISPGASSASGAMAIAAIGQFCATASMAHNLKQCQTLVQKAVAAGAKALFLPEASDYISSSGEESVSLVKSVTDSEFVLGLQQEAREKKLPINVGVHEPAQGGKKVKNTLLWIDGTGEIVQRYQKIHLFDVEIKDGPVLKESRSVEKGSAILPPFDTPIGRVGLTICFDLRFPEISLALKRQGSQIISFPSAFTVPTGHAHWEPLLRARAIETQNYILAAAQVGRHNEKRVSYGHSMIVSPWGEIIAELGGTSEDAEIATAEIDLAAVEKIKAEMPLLRRTDVYPEI